MSTETILGEGRIRRIATEEAFQVPEIASALRKIIERSGQSLDLPVLRKAYMNAAPSDILTSLLDIEGSRLRDMDRLGIDMHLLSLSCPGVQLFDADLATNLAMLANDYLADIVQRHPRRFAGLASFAPQATERAVIEMERAITRLKLHGFIVNSHTNNEYLDHPKFWPLLEAAESLDACLYLHPRAPSDGMAAPFRDYAMATATWGFGLETSTHALRLILGGIFDRFPKLKICLGHMGEGLHFWLFRIDLMHARSQHWGHAPRLQLTPSEYFRRNFVISTCGLEDVDVLEYSIKKLGVENILWSIDYPFQPMAPAVTFIDNAPISRSDRQRIYHLNAERIFHIPRMTELSGVPNL
jgi:2,3-dihydroxybenzoate decarboxylase/5-carboxyvanillate decarboxylase